MSWLDQFFVGYVTVAVGGVPLAQEPILNLVNATGVDNPLLTRTDVTLAASSGIGGGSTGAAQTGAVVLPGTTACIAVNIGSGDATCNVGQIATPADGQAYQFDLIGTSTGNTFTLTGATFLNAGATSTTFVITGSGKFATIKYNAATSVWILTTW